MEPVVDLLQFFRSYRSSREEFGKLMNAFDGVDDPGVRLLALEGILRIEGDVRRNQLSYDHRSIDFLREWRSRSPLDGVYSGVLGMVPPILGSFTIFKALEVPLIDDYESKLQGLTKALDGVDPSAAVLALEGLFRIILSAGVMHRCDFPYGGPAIKHIRNMLREWRCQSLLGWKYEAEVCGVEIVPKFLRSLTIFKTLEVPLFIDNYGSKKQLISYGETEDISINGDTPIFHVTHRKEAGGIVNDKHFKPSAKNMIEGTWFGLGSAKSVYGPYAFETTLSKLGVTGLHQGEIVAYKHEVNVILYAADDTDFAGVWKPTKEAVKKGNLEAYVHVSVFVPSLFLPDPDNFWEVISKPAKVDHGTFCVRAKRLRTVCAELGNVLVDDMQGMHLSN